MVDQFSGFFRAPVQHPCIAKDDGNAAIRYLPVLQEVEADLGTDPGGVSHCNGNSRAAHAVTLSSVSKTGMPRWILPAGCRPSWICLMGNVMRCDYLPVPDKGEEIWSGGRQTGGRSRVRRAGEGPSAVPGAISPERFTS